MNQEVEKDTLFIFNIRDRVFIVLVFLLSGLSFIFLQNPLSEKSSYVVIRSGEKNFRFPLGKNKKVNIPSKLGDMEIEIKNNAVRVVHSMCEKKICVDTGWIRNFNHPIVCVPGEVVITVEKKGQPSVDSITY